MDAVDTVQTSKNALLKNIINYIHKKNLQYCVNIGSDPRL